MVLLININYIDFIFNGHKLTPEFDFDKEITKKVWDFFIKIMPSLGFESREGQENMALDICEAIIDNKHIMIEAGVGIGKSYAYLIPLMYYNKLTNNPVLVSTSTILLQEQLVKDIKNISEMLNIYPEIVLAKGMSHFVCNERAFSYLNYNKKFIKEYPWLENWIEDIENGDRTKLPIQLSDSIWNNLNVSNCKPRECEYGFKCYYSKRRNRMVDTRGIILCNHDLLAVDIQRKNKKQKAILSKDIKLIVIDESHNLEDKVRNSLKQEWSFGSCVKGINEAIFFIRKTYSYDNMEGGAFKLFEEVYNEFWEQVQEQYNDLRSDIGDIEKFYIKSETIHKKISLIIEIIDELNTKVQLVQNNRFDNTQDNIIENLENASEFFQNLILRNSNVLFWIELRNKRKSFKDIVIVGCPKKLNNEIRQLFFEDEKPKTILTSATLTNSFSGTNEERYSYMIKNLGYPIGNNGELSEPKESPYPYNENCLIYYKENMPHPTKDRELFIEKCIDTIVELLSLTNGKAMILFTAKSDMVEVYNKLISKKLSWKILIQQEGSSQDLVISEFKSNINSILLGTGVYWEGISIEGIALSNLIIVRLPFHVPDPVIDYKKSLTNNPLMEVDVPEMLVKLRQGVGRLIRNYTDNGIITILDPRVGDNSNRPYKNAIWEALPMKIKTNDINVVKNFVNENINI
jgi:ATP-dependent DNA helicase DinG